MNPFIFQFKEAPTAETLDHSLLEYDPTLNLSVYKPTGAPAIESISMGTTTFTKTQGEAADTDRNALSLLMETKTMTFVNSETSDSDKDSHKLQMLLDTTTVTRSTEASDQDK